MASAQTPQADNAWQYRTVLITGGTSGTGLRAAEKFLARGANVVINGRAPDRAQDALQALRAISSRVALSVADCGDYPQAARMVTEATDAFGGIDILVSAGASGTA